MDQQTIIKSEPDEFPNIDYNDQLPTYNLLDESGDLYEDECRAVKMEQQIQDDPDHEMDIKVEESSIPEFVPFLDTETSSSDLKEEVKEEIKDQESVGSGNQLNEHLKLFLGDSAVWWKAGLCIAAATAVSFLVVKVLKVDKR